MDVNFYRAGLGKPLASVLTAVVLAATISPVFAQPDKVVSLDAKDGTMTISGYLLDHDDHFIILETQEFGALRIEAASVDCKGAACPALPASSTAPSQFSSVTFVSDPLVMQSNALHYQSWFDAAAQE